MQRNTEHIKNPNRPILKDIISGLNYVILGMLIIITILNFTSSSIKTIIITAFLFNLVTALLIASINIKKSIVLFLSFVIVSAIILLPLFFKPSDNLAFLLSIFNSFILLFIFGIGEAYINKKSPLKDGLKIVFIGVMLELLTYGVAKFIISLLK